MTRDGAVDSPALDPGRESFREMADREEPAVVRLAADLDVAADPLTAYAALAGDADYAFLLESAPKTASSDPDGAFRPSGEAEDRHARYSFVGYDPDAAVSVRPGDPSVERLRGTTASAHLAPDGNAGDVLDVLRDALPAVDRVGFPETDRQLLDGGLVGFLAYDAVYDLWLEEVGVERPETPLPDAQFVLNTKTLVFDHGGDAGTDGNGADGETAATDDGETAATVRLVFTPVVDPGDDLDALYDDLRAEADRVAAALADADPPETGGFRRVAERAGPQDEYETAVRRAKEHVRDGDVYQDVVSRTRELDGRLDPLGLYESLREVNPSPYMYVLDYGERTVVGASPETLVSVRGEEVLSNPIAGTCPRGSSPVEDRRLAGEMLADGKERAEHTMLVDLARNDVRRVSEPGSVRVTEFMSVLKYSHVQHIESTVTGRLAADCDAFDAVRASFPAGTLSGAPKIRAMELIDDLELRPRGIYGGGVGYVSWTDDADFAIVIRTATVDGRGEYDTVTVRAGAGVVADSDPTAEYEETETKMDGVLTALERMEREARATGGSEGLGTGERRSREPEARR